MAMFNGLAMGTAVIVLMATANMGSISFSHVKPDLVLIGLQ